MLKLIKNVEVYTPDYLGKKDVLITADKIGYIQESIDLGETLEIETIDGTGKFLVPGFIDNHVHILGGGGEGSFRTRTPELMLSDVTRAGITTIVGLLGTDGFTRTMSNLIAKANGLEEEGVTCYVCTGSYQVPVKTLLDSIQEDIILIEKIIGVGEIAISDHRSSQPTIEEITKIAAAARVGGLLSGKAGFVNIHIGDGHSKLSFLEEITRNTEIPITQFIPTHVNRNLDLFESAIEYAKNGGLIDLTTSTCPEDESEQKGEATCCRLLKRALDSGVPIENVTFSSDGQGSLPVFDGNGEYVKLEVGTVGSLFNQVRNTVKYANIPLQTALKVITTNSARNLKLPDKGSIETGKDADLVLLDKNLEIDTVIARGQTMVENKKVVVKGTFEK